MKTIFQFVFFFFMAGLHCFSQDKQVNQPILDLTVSDLQKIGVIIKNQQIIINNNIPDHDKFQLIIHGNNYHPKVESSLNIPETNFDFYPYYFTSTDSAIGFFCQDVFENELKNDPLFRRKMFDLLVPIRIKQSDNATKWGNEIILWFTPTDEFRKLLSDKYTINRKYTSDSLITSEVALKLSDEALKNIGFVITDDEMYFETYMNDPAFTSQYVTIWYNNKKEFGTETITGDVSKIINKKDPQNKGYDIKSTGYYIVKVTDVNGKINFEIPNLKVALFLFTLKTPAENIRTGRT